MEGDMTDNNREAADKLPGNKASNDRRKEK